MKGFLRASLAVFLALLLVFFALWRYDKLSKPMAYISGAIARLEELLNLSEKPAGGGPQGTPTDPGSDFSGYQPTEVNAGLRSTLLAALMRMDSAIDVGAHNPTKAELSAAMADIVYSTPELFYLDLQYSYVTGFDQRVRTVTPSYLYSAAQVETMRSEYHEALSLVVAGAPKDGSDFDKVLYLHDYFIKNYTYDQTLTIRDAYTFLTGRTGVCQAYMLAFMAAARELGVLSVPVTSDAMKHAWNLVQLDGAWYHVDITWDDANTLPSRISYTYFLQSDQGLVQTDSARPEAERHREWVTAHTAENSRFDEALFRRANTGMVQYGGEYFVAVREENSSSSVRGTVFAGTDPTALTKRFDIKGGVFLAGISSYYPDCYSDLLVRDGVLYFHSGNSVGMLDLTTEGAAARVLYPAGIGMGSSIYGFLSVGDTELVLIVATSPSATVYQTVRVPLS